MLQSMCHAYVADIQTMAQHTNVKHASRSDQLIARVCSAAVAGSGHKSQVSLEGIPLQLQPWLGCCTWFSFFMQTQGKGTDQPGVRTISLVRS